MKKTSLRFRITVIALILICAGVLALPYFTAMSERIIMVQTKPDTRITFYALVANTLLKRASGLQNVKTMPEDTAMLFTFDEPINKAMWMKDTHIPLDMLFIRDGVIVHIERNAQPLSEARITSPEPYNAVLEINAGLADMYNISVGNVIF